MLSETNHGNRDTERCLLFSFSSLLQEACFQPILLQYSRPRRIMCQTLGVRLILEKNASFESHFRRSIFFYLQLSRFSGCHVFQFQQILAKCEMHKSSIFVIHKGKIWFTPVEREASHEHDSVEVDTESTSLFHLYLTFNTR